MWSGLLIVLVLLVSSSHQSPVQRHLSDVDNPPQQLLDRLSYWDELYSNHPQNDNIKRSSYDADAFWKRGKSEGSNAAFWKRGSNDADYASFWKRAGPSDRQIEQFWKRGGLFMEEPAAFWKRGEQDAWPFDREILDALRRFVMRKHGERQQDTQSKNLSYEVIDENTRDGEISPQEHKEEHRRGESIQPEFNPSGW
jgi:hypothetical protein